MPKEIAAETNAILVDTRYYLTGIDNYELLYRGGVHLTEEGANNLCRVRNKLNKGIKKISGRVRPDIFYLYSEDFEKGFARKPPVWLVVPKSFSYA